MPVKTKKPSAADRTVDMFGSVPTTLDERPVEVIPDEAKTGERVSLEQDADRMRDVAFQGQEWTTKYFGVPDAQGNEYRVSHKGQHYYLECLHKTEGAREAYGYSGLMVHERDLYNMVAVLVQAVREKQKREANEKHA